MSSWPKCDHCGHSFVSHIVGLFVEGPGCGDEGCACEFYERPEAAV